MYVFFNAPSYITSQQHASHILQATSMLGTCLRQHEDAIMREYGD